MYGVVYLSISYIIELTGDYVLVVRMHVACLVAGKSAHLIHRYV